MGVDDKGSIRAETTMSVDIAEPVMISEKPELSKKHTTRL
jgi:hypothetical protein